MARAAGRPSRLALMQVHVISDLEGVAGIVKGGQTSGGEPMFEEARRLYTEEINAAVRGAKAAGATEIVVMDCHGAGKEWSFNSLVPELLDPDCESSSRRTGPNTPPFSRKAATPRCSSACMHVPGRGPAS